MKLKKVKTTTVYQMEAAECGAASLSMIFSFFGRHMSLEEMRIETGVSRDGCNAANIMRAAKKYGLECHGYHKELSGLLKLKPPCIIHWNFNHFVVYEGAKGEYVYINDPAAGRYRLTVEEASESFSGIVLTFSPTCDFEKQKCEKSFSESIRKRLAGHSSMLVKLLISGILLALPAVAVPVLSQIMTDKFIAGADSRPFGLIIGVILAFACFGAVFSFYRNMLIQKLQNKIAVLSTYNFLNHLFRLPIAFFEQRYVGDLGSRVAENNRVNSFVGGDLVRMAVNVFTMIFCIVVMIVYSPYLSVIAVSGLIISILVMKISSHMISSVSVKLQQDYGKFSGVVSTGIGITSELKASGSENDYASKVMGCYDGIINSEHKLMKMRCVVNVLPDMVSLFTSLAVIAFGGVMVINGDITAGVLVSFGMLMAAFNTPVNEFAGFTGRIQMIKAYISRIDDIMDYKKDEKFETTCEKRHIRHKLSGKVEFDNVSFGYSSLAEPLIKNFSLSVSPGSSVAVTGASGSGKSTIVKLLGGLYMPWEGKIRFDDIAAEEISPAVISASVSTVSQNITLFSGTIRDNITLWNTAVSEEDMIRAAKDACIHDIITQKPGAYDYVLSEDASNLSGGQRQRLEIARALVTNPTVLVMDEATSALDPVTEKEILDNIRKRGCTCIIIAHRLSTVRDCDKIIVMHRGEILSEGTHETLVKSDEIYRTFTENI